jgi:hypothetical protein
LCIRGLYIEWPSDPWEHLRRIAMWHDCGSIRDHPAPFKSGYFLFFSLVGWASDQQFLVASGICVLAAGLLLGWQYYLLATALRLSRGAAFGSALLALLLLGNSTFDFARYYGASSTIIAQIGAVAMSRVAVRVCWPGGPRRNSWLRTAAYASALLLLMAMNHVQGLAIGLIAMLAVAMASVFESRRRLFWFIAGAIVAANIGTYVYVRQSGLSAPPPPWASPWFGFDIFAPQSLAGQRANEILSFFGWANLAVGVLLLARNQMIGWLTVAPALALSMPLVAVPFAAELQRDNTILTFHRLLLGIPPGFAVCIGLEYAFQRASCCASTRCRRLFLSACPAAVLLTLTAVPTNAPWYNRFWSALSRIPRDLCMDDAVAAPRPAAFHPSPRVWASTSAVASVREILSTDPTIGGGRRINEDTAGFAALTMRVLAEEQLKGRRDAFVLVPCALAIYTPGSVSALASRHWPLQRVALDHSAGPEVREWLRARGGAALSGPGPEVLVLRRSAARSRP